MINAFEQKKLPKSIAGILQLVASASPRSYEQRRSALLAPLVFPSRSSLEVYCDYGAIAEDDHMIAAPPRPYVASLCSSCEQDQVLAAYNQFLEEPEARIKAIVPSSLRRGFFCKSGSVDIEDRRFFERVAGWRCLAAALFATLRFGLSRSITAPPKLNEVESALISTARSQRSLAGSLFSSHESVIGDLNALALEEDQGAPRGYLLAVNRLSQDVVDAPNFVARAKSALRDVKTSSPHHVILMTDDVRSCFKGSFVSYRKDGDIHLVGNENKIRFVIVFSSVPELLAAEEESPDRHFALSVSRLRDLFLDRAKIERNNLLSMRGVGKSQNVDSRIKVGRTVLYDPEGAEEFLAHDTESVLSRTKLARRFFGYRGLPDTDLL